jgi:hypothetical protein
MLSPAVLDPLSESLVAEDDERLMVEELEASMVNSLVDIGGRDVATCRDEELLRGRMGKGPAEAFE